MNVQQTIKSIADLIIDASIRANRPISKAQFVVIHQSAGSNPLPLPAGKMAVYSFFYTATDTCLKVGQANAKSNARYQSQHYGMNANSTLTKSLITDPQMPMVSETNWQDWVKNNCERFDVLIDAKLGKITLNFIEGLLQYFFQPKYEG